METQHQGAKPPPLVRCLYFSASPLLNDLHHSGFVSACTDAFPAVWRSCMECWSSGCCCTLYFHSSVKIGLVSASFSCSALKCKASQMFVFFMLIALSCFLTSQNIYFEKLRGYTKITAILPVFCSHC